MRAGRGAAAMMCASQCGCRDKSYSFLVFLLPFAVLLALWSVLVPYFNVNPRLFPTLGSVAQAGFETIQRRHPVRPHRRRACGVFLSAPRWR